MRPDYVAHYSKPPHRRSRSPGSDGARPGSWARIVPWFAENPPPDSECLHPHLTKMDSYCLLDESRRGWTHFFGAARMLAALVREMSPGYNSDFVVVVEFEEPFVGGYTNLECSAYLLGRFAEASQLDAAVDTVGIVFVAGIVAETGFPVADACGGFLADFVIGSCSG